MAFCLLIFLIFSGRAAADCEVGWNQPPSPGNLFELVQASIQEVTETTPAIDIFFHELTFEPLIQLLEEKASKGFSIRVYLEQSTMLSGGHRLDLAGPLAIERLRRAGMEVRTDFHDGSGAGRAHSKYLLLPPETVVTGSWNATATGLLKNANHMIRVRSKELFERYRKAFEEYAWNEQDLRRLPVRSQGSYEACFPPQESCLPMVQEFLLESLKPLDLFLFQFSEPHLMQTLAWQSETGRNIRLTLDRRGLGFRLPQGGRMRDWIGKRRIQAHLPGTEGLWHHKTAFTKTGFLSGSLNWSTEAFHKSQENILWVKDEICAGKFHRAMLKSGSLSAMPETSLPLSVFPNTRIQKVRIAGPYLEVWADPSPALTLEISDREWSECETRSDAQICRLRDYQRLQSHAITLRHTSSLALDGIAFQGGSRINRKSWHALAELKARGIWAGCPDDFTSSSCFLNWKEVAAASCYESLSDTGFKLDWQPCPSSEE